MLRLYFLVEFVDLVDECEMNAFCVLLLLYFSDAVEDVEASVREGGLRCFEVFLELGWGFESYYFFRTHAIICF